MSQLASRVRDEISRCSAPDGHDRSECLESPRAKNTYGYPVIKWEGRVRTLLQLVLEVKSGPKPDGYEGCHSCGNRACINPDHLRWDSRSGNAIDRSRDGTQTAQVLNEEQVVKIRRLLKKGWKCTELAHKYKVHASAIERIKSGETWGWL